MSEFTLKQIRDEAFSGVNLTGLFSETYWARIRFLIEEIDKLEKGRVVAAADEQKYKDIWNDLTDVEREALSRNNLDLMSFAIYRSLFKRGLVGLKNSTEMVLTPDGIKVLATQWAARMDPSTTLRGAAYNVAEVWKAWERYRVDGQLEFHKWIHVAYGDLFGIVLNQLAYAYDVDRKNRP